VNNTTNSDAQALEDVFICYALKQHVHCPTHISSNTLDLILTEESGTLILSEPSDDLYISDHSVISSLLNIPKPAKTREIITYRKIKNINRLEFRSDLSNLVDRIENLSSVDDLAELYHQQLTEVIDKHAPLITKSIVVRPTVPWYSESIQALHREKRHLEKQWRKSRGEADWIKYKTCRNTYRYFLELAKTKCYNDAVVECGQDTKKLFKTIMGLLNRTTNNPLPKIEPGILSEQFADYFYNKIVKIRRSLEGCDMYTPTHREVPQLTEFSPLSQDQVMKLVKTSRATTALVDPCPSSLVKDNADIMCPIITKIINTSLITSTFATKWKTAVVLPLLK
jgi:hypothetical protein